jgi:hypothetical protein
MIRAYLALNESKPAATIGEAMIGELEAAKPPILSEKDEAAVRSNYATALEKSGATQLARVQREIGESPGCMREQREKQVRDALLSRRRQRPAPPFTLKDLTGNAAKLEHFRDRTVVLIF